MSIKYGSNRFFPRGDSGGGGGGADLWTLYGGTVVGLTTLTDTVAIGTNAMLADEKLLVAGGIAATPTIAGNDAFLQVGSGDSTVLSGANSVRFIYNAGTMQAEISTNGGAFVPLASGGASPWLAAAGVITEVVPANLVVVGSAAALNADQFQVLGDSTLRASVDSIRTFEVQGSGTNYVFRVDTVNNASVVRGSYQMSSGSTGEVYLESGPSTAANSGAGAGRIRYNNAGTPSWQGSVNGGAFSDFITAATLPTLAFVQNGNSFGATAVLGTNDGHNLHFEVNGSALARLTTTNQFLVGQAHTVPITNEIFSVAGGILSRPTVGGAGNDSYLQIGDGAGVAVSTANAGRFRYNAGVAQVSLNTGAYSDLITAATLPTVAFVQNGNSFGADAVLGTNDAFALQFETSGVTRGRFTSTGAFLVAAAAAAGTESLRVTGGGILNDGTQHTVSVTSALAINNSGGAINIGNNADAQAINLGTGAAARTITLGNSTGATSLVLDAGTGPISIGTSNFARTTSIATGAAVQSVTIGSTTANSSITLQANTGAITMQTLAGTDFILIGTTASARTVNIATGGAAQAVAIGSSTGASSLTLNAGTGPISIGTSASARTTSIATGAAAQTVNIGSTNTTSSIANSFGTNGFGLIQGAASSGTPIGVLMSAGAHTGLASAEVSDVNFNLARTVTFGAGGGTIATQRAFRVQAPTYAAAAAITLTDAASVSVSSAPTPGANVTMTRRMALWVQAGVARFDGGVGVKVTPGGTTVQGLGADFRKTNDPGSVSYPAGVSTVGGGAYTPATGYLSIIPALWTLPAAINSGGGVGPPLNPGIRFNWSDGTTAIRYNTSTASSLTETRDSIDFNKDGLTIVGVDFVVDNTSGGAATVDFTAWTVDGNQF